MKNSAKTFRVLSDESRLRILMLLTRGELCVCQMMGVLGMSQPLVSRNLSLLKNAGFLDERRDGKLIFYSIKKDLQAENRGILNLLKRQFDGSKTLANDLESLSECHEFQKRTGKCDMKTLKAFMKQKKKKRSGGRYV